MRKLRSSIASHSDILNAARSRDATNILLGGLHGHHLRPRAWTEFLTAATLRSLSQARAHPRPFLQVTALHLAIGLVADKRHRTWVATSWALAVSHLGLLEAKQNLGLPNTITLIRANLPAVEDRLGRWVPVLALISDFVDGEIARKTGAVTVFGDRADFLADTALWTWFIVRHETSRRATVCTFAVWAVPVAAISVASFAKGRMIDIPQLRWLRPSAAVEVFIGARVIQRLFIR